MARVSWATLLTAYGLNGRSGLLSAMGASSGYTSPYSSLEPAMWMTGASRASRTASNRLTCETMLLVRVAAGAVQLVGTKLWAARWKILSGCTARMTPRTALPSWSSQSITVTWPRLTNRRRLGWSVIRWPSSSTFSLPRLRRSCRLSSLLRQRKVPKTSTSGWWSARYSARKLPAIPVMPVIRTRTVSPLAWSRSMLRRHRRGRAAALLPPILQRIAQGRVPGYAGLPACQRRELAGVGLLFGNISGSQQRRVDARLDRDPAHAPELVDHLGDAHRASAAEIVDVARATPDQRQAVGAHHVARVGEVALDVQVADAQHRLPRPGLDLGQLPGKAGDDEARVVARAGVVERPHAHDRQAVLGEVLEAHHVLADLADGVRRGRPEGHGLVRRHLVWADPTVLVAGANHQDARSQASAEQAFEQVDLGQQVVADRRPRVAEALGRRRLGGQVVHRLGLGFAHDTLDRRAVGQIGAEHAHAADAAHVGGPSEPADLVAFFEEVVHQVSTDKPTHARDQGSHLWRRVPPLPLGVDNTVRTPHPWMKPLPAGEGEFMPTCRCPSW